MILTLDFMLIFETYAIYFDLSPGSEYILKNHQGKP